MFWCFFLIFKRTYCSILIILMLLHSKRWFDNFSSSVKYLTSYCLKLNFFRHHMWVLNLYNIVTTAINFGITATKVFFRYSMCNFNISIFQAKKRIQTLHWSQCISHFNNSPYDQHFKPYRITPISETMKFI